MKNLCTLEESSIFLNLQRKSHPIVAKFDQKFWSVGNNSSLLQPHLYHKSHAHYGGSVNR